MQPHANVALHPVRIRPTKQTAAAPPWGDLDFATANGRLGWLVCLSVCVCDTTLVAIASFEFTTAQCATVCLLFGRLSR